MAVRIRNFGGVIQELAPGASLDRDDLRLVFCRTASRLAYLAYVTRGLLRLSLENPRHRPGIQRQSVSCDYCVHQARAAQDLRRSRRRTARHPPGRNHGRPERSDLAGAAYPR